MKPLRDQTMNPLSFSNYQGLLIFPLSYKLSWTNKMSLHDMYLTLHKHCMQVNYLL